MSKGAFGDNGTSRRCAFVWHKPFSVTREGVEDGAGGLMSTITEA